MGERIEDARRGGVGVGVDPDVVGLGVVHRMAEGVAGGLNRRVILEKIADLQLCKCKLRKF